MVTDPALPFASVVALKTAHGELLKRYRESLASQSGQRDESEHLLALLPEINQFLERGRLTGSIIDAEDDRAASQTYLDYWASIIYRAGLTRDEKVHDDATLIDFDPNLAPAISEDRCPYIGLDAFQESNTGFFYGRKKLVDDILTKMKSERFLAVIGPSGSGKSSVVLAGLLPALKAGALGGSETWNYYLPMVPSANPLRSLALAVRPKGKTEQWVNEQVELFKSDPRQLLKLFEQSSSSTSVLLIDQFEEVFTLCSDEKLLGAFVQNLLAVAEDTDHRIIITMRIEFQEQLPRLDALYPLFLNGLIQILPLSATDLRDVIEKPAAEVGLKFEHGIVESLVKEIVGEPAGLPLLQFTLLELWKRRRRNRVLLEDYNKLGGARRALTNVASAVYDELPIQEQVVAKRIFLRLAWTGETVEILRNRVARRALHQAAGSSDQVDAVLRKLVAARLVRLTRDEFALSDKESLNDQFEVAHEALIRNWQLLIDWLQAAQGSLRVRIRVRSAAEQWLAHGKDPGGLLGGSLLEDAAKHTDLDDLEKQFIKASQDAEKEGTLARESARLREMNQLQALADQQTRAARQLKIYLALSALGLLILAGTSIFAFAKRSEAYGQRREAEAQRREADQQRAMAVSSANKAEANRLEAVDFAAKAEVSRLQAIDFAAEAKKQSDRAKKLQATAEEKAALAQQKELEAQQARKLAEQAQVAAEKAKRDVEQALIIVQARKDEVEKLKADLLTQNKDLDSKNKELVKATAEAKESYLTSVVAQNDLTRELRELQTQAEEMQLAASTVTTFSADGSRLLTFSAFASPRVWDTKSSLVIIEGGADALAAALSPDGKLLATSGFFGDVVVQDVASGRTVSEIETNTLLSSNKLVFSSNSQTLALLEQTSGTVTLFDPKTGKQIVDLSSAAKDVASVGFSSDGQKVALTTIKGESTLVSLGASNQLVKRTLASGLAGCRESTIDLLNFSPSRDLKASLRLETTCQGEGGTEGGERATRGLSKEQAAIALAPVDSRAKPVNVAPASDNTPANVPKTSGNAPVKVTAPRPVEPSYQRLFKLVFKVYRKNPKDDQADPFDEEFLELCSMDFSTTADQEILAAFDQLAKSGISGDDVRDISDDINDLAKKFSELPGNDDDPKKIAEYQKLTMELFKKIMAELKIPSRDVAP